jgi:molecular chaperone GrpE
VTRDPEEEQHHGPVIRDKRRIDPVTGQVRERRETAAPPSPAGGNAGAAPASTTTVEAELAERTSDLQRLQAEYLNYKRRVDRERENVRKNAVSSTLTALLPVLDDIARAREHDELTGGFKAVADSFERIVSNLGLTPFGEVGDEFDPRIHEALMHSFSDDVDKPVCQVILQVGYRIDDRVIRPARVAVAEPDVVAPPAAAGDETAFVLEEEPDDPGVAAGGPSYDDNDSAGDGASGSSNDTSGAGPRA